MKVKERKDTYLEFGTSNHESRFTYLFVLNFRF